MVLHNVLMSKAARGDMRQVPQSRAEIYRDELDPKQFKSMSDLGTKAKSLGEKNPSPTRGGSNFACSARDTKFQTENDKRKIGSATEFKIGYGNAVGRCAQDIKQDPVTSSIETMLWQQRI